MTIAPMSVQAVAAPAPHEVLSVDPLAPAAIREYNLELPEVGRGSGHAVRLQGWVLAHDLPIESVAVKFGEDALVRIRPNHPRPDVVDGFGIHDDRVAGFTTAVNLLGLPERLHLTVEVGLRGHEQDLPVWLLELTRERVVPSSPMGVAPVAITTIGRTGSTWLASLLDAHPEIVLYPPWEAEPRYLSYWLEVAKTLTQPSSYLVPLMPPDMSTDDWWHVRREAPLAYPADESVASALTSGHVNAVVDFARARTSAFYEEVARATRAGGARLFAEKLLPNARARRLLREVFPDVREVILVRDFRDMAASIIAIDRRRGYHGFGREPHDDDRAYVARLARAAESLADAAEAAAGAMVVRYEDLAGDPAGVLGCVLRHLGVAADPGDVEHMVAAADEPTPERESHRTSTDRSASIGRWRRDLSPEFRAMCEPAFAPSLARFGYSP
jgi:hypothetical protein